MKEALLEYIKSEIGRLEAAKIAPLHVSEIEVRRYGYKLISQALNDLYNEGKISVCKGVNDRFISLRAMRRK